MADRLRVTILGCGSSPGTPRINGDWGNCDPENPKNRRRRASAMFERVSQNGATTRVVVDTGPDFRDQMIGARVAMIDAAVYTHPHADHIHGIDDLRGYALAKRALMDIYGDDATLERLYAGFGYCFETPPGSRYPPILKANPIDPSGPFAIAGEGGAIPFTPLVLEHGDIHALGFRVGDVAYCPDVSGIPPATADKMKGLALLVVDALQYRRHPSHFSLEQTLEWVERLKPGRTLLTHMHIPLDYDVVRGETPDHVEPAYDGQVLEFPIATESAL